MTTRILTSLLIAFIGFIAGVIFMKLREYQRIELQREKESGVPGPVRRAQQRNESRAALRANCDDRILNAQVLTNESYGVLEESLLEEKV